MSSLLIVIIIIFVSVRHHLSPLQIVQAGAADGVAATQTHRGTLVDLRKQHIQILPFISSC